LFRHSDLLNSWDGTHRSILLSGRASDNVYHHGPLPILGERLDVVSETDGPCVEKAVLGILPYGASATRLKQAEL
jgi:hypothetical protein